MAVEAEHPGARPAHPLRADHRWGYAGLDGDVQAERAQALGEPVGGARDVARVGRVGADAGDPDQLDQVGERAVAPVGRQRQRA